MIAKLLVGMATQQLQKTQLVLPNTALHLCMCNRKINTRANLPDHPYRCTLSFLDFLDILCGKAKAVKFTRLDHVDMNTMNKALYIFCAVNT